MSSSLPSLSSSPAGWLDPHGPLTRGENRAGTGPASAQPPAWFGASSGHGVLDVSLASAAGAASVQELSARFLERLVSPS